MVIFCFFDKNVWSSRFTRRLELNALYILFGFYINCTDFWGFPLDGVIDWWNRRVFYFFNLFFQRVIFNEKSYLPLPMEENEINKKDNVGLFNSSRKLIKYNIKKNVFYTINAMLFFICIKDYTHELMYMYIRVVLITAHFWYNCHFISISACGVWGERVEIQVLKNKCHTYIRLY